MAELKGTSLFNDANIISYYQLENTNDNKGTNNLTNHNSVAFNAAKYGNGADLGTNNTNKDLYVATNFGIDGGNISISLWVKLQTEITSSSYVFFAQNSSGTKTAYAIYYDYNGGTIRLRSDRAKSGSGSDDALYTITLGTTKWYHLVLTYNGTTLFLYVNGVQQATTPASGNGTSAVTSESYIGALQTVTPGTGQLFASAIIDDVAIFNRALTATEILTLFQDYGGGAFLGLF